MEATESCGNAAKSRQVKKNLMASACVVLLLEYDSSIPDTQNTMPVAGETEMESPHVEQGVCVYHHRRTGPPNHEYLLESKPLPQGSILGKEFQL